MHIIRQHIYTAKTIFFAVQISRYIPSYTSREVANKHTAIQLIAVIILTSSPRSKLNASCVLNVFSLAHFSQISSSVFAKSNAGGRLAMMLSQMAFQRHLLWRYYHQQLKICYQSQGGSLAVVLSCIEAFLVRYLIGRVRIGHILTRASRPKNSSQVSLQITTCTKIQTKFPFYVFA